LRNIFDEVVGFIDLDPTEQALYSHPIFARLGNIKQLGLAYATFPGANHTRLSHSLGTMHYAGRIADVLKLPDKKSKQEIRAGALLHDVGHPPLSHTFEHYLRDAYDAQTASSMVETQGGEKKASSSKAASHLVEIEIRKLLGSELNPFDNSVLSAILVARSSISNVLQKSELSADEIAKIIAGKRLPQYFSQVLDSGLDADKMDYLQRDKHGTGVPYGSIDIEHILRCLRLEDNLICVDDSGANACLHLLLARYFWYTQVVLNKNVHAYEEMAKLMYRSLASLGLLPSTTELLDTLDGIIDGRKSAEDSWIQFDDTNFYYAMAQAKNLRGKRDDSTSSPLPPDVLLDYINRIQNRIPMPRVVRIDAVETPRKTAGSKLDYDNQHPRYHAYLEFKTWLNENKSDEIAEGRIIVSERRIEVTKPRDDPESILIKSQFDDRFYVLQEHYYSIILPIAVVYPQYPIRFAACRVYCVDEIASSLKAKWKKLSVS
jgi:HD superfamily phosphohydrolase